MIACVAWSAAVVSSAQFDDSPFEIDHPAIAYSKRQTSSVVDALNARLQSGQVTLPFEPTTGYLKPLLDALNVSVDSQIVVFSKTSLQSQQIQPRNPRAIYFNDSVVVAWVRGGFIEIAAHDPAQGAVFYRVLRAVAGPPALFRDNSCLGCHNSFATLGVPGFLAKSVPSAVDGSALPWLGNYLTDHRSPITERWAGWFVTGNAGTSRHLGNAPVANRNIDEVTVDDANLKATDLRSRFDANNYLSPYSDVVALLVFNHQLRMMNLLTRVGWEARALAHAGRSDAAHRRRASRYRDRDSGLHAVRGRGAAHRRHWIVRLCHVVQRARATRQQGPIAARSRAAPASLHTSVQLHDLFGGLRAAARRRKARDLYAVVGRALGRGTCAEVRAALIRRS